MSALVTYYVMSYAEPNIDVLNARLTAKEFCDEISGENKRQRFPSSTFTLSLCVCFRRRMAKGVRHSHVRVGSPECVAPQKCGTTCHLSIEP